MHRSASTGPRTAEGLARSRLSRWKHGLYSAEALAEPKRAREVRSQSRELLKQMQIGLNRRLHGAWGSSDSQELLLAKRGSLQTKKPQTRLSPGTFVEQCLPLRT
jgi:hypothetical protein